MGDNNEDHVIIRYIPMNENNHRYMKIYNELYMNGDDLRIKE
jgi:hypothetical protein